MRSILKPGLVLLLITFITSALLGYVNHITKAPIAALNAKTRVESMQELIPEATAFKEVKQAGTEPKNDIIYDESVAYEVAAAAEKAIVQSVSIGYTDADELVGYVIGANPKGYSGAVDILVGIRPDGVLSGIKIVSHNETPGLGANATNVEFTDQYKGKTGTLNVIKPPTTVGEQDIQAMTSATITTNAVTKGVNEATTFFNDIIRR